MWASMRTSESQPGQLRANGRAMIIALSAMATAMPTKTR